MNFSDLLSEIYFLTAIILLIYMWRLRSVPRVYLTDYMRGVRFVKGTFAGILGPGGHRPLSRRVHIEVVDMRPIPFILDSISYQDALRNDSWVSIGADLSVVDPYLAVTSLKSRVNDTLPIVRDMLRTVVSRSICDTDAESRAKAAKDIAEAVNEELRRVGVKISNVEITELFSRNSAPRGVNTGLN